MLPGTHSRVELLFITWYPGREGRCGIFRRKLSRPCLKLSKDCAPISLAGSMLYMARPRDVKKILIVLRCANRTFSIFSSRR